MILHELLAALLLGESNFKVMHWQFKGSHFDTYHKNVSSEYYDLCADQADVVAEMLARMGYDTLNYSDVLNVIDESKNDYIVIKADEFYGEDDFVSNTKEIFRGILKLIAMALQTDEIANQITNVGIKSSLEAMYETFDLQHRYINARR